MTVHFLPGSRSVEGIELASPVLGLTARCYNLLRRGGFRTIAEVEDAADVELLDIRSMRETDVAAIRAAITAFRARQETTVPHPAFRSRDER